MEQGSIRLASDHPYFPIIMATEKQCHENCVDQKNNFLWNIWMVDLGTVKDIDEVVNNEQN